MTDFIEQAEKAKLLERLSGQDFAIDELRAALKQENAACKRLEAENAKLRQVVRHALELAKIIERGDRIDGDAYASSEIVNTLRAALGSDPAPSPWRNIESAPKDGTPVLLRTNREVWEHTGFCRVAGYWDGYGWAVYGAGGAEPVSGQGHLTGNVQRADSCNPTHWMPLPDVRGMRHD